MGSRGMALASALSLVAMLVLASPGVGGARTLGTARGEATSQMYRLHVVVGGNGESSLAVTLQSHASEAVVATFHVTPVGGTSSFSFQKVLDPTVPGIIKASTLAAESVQAAQASSAGAPYLVTVESAAPVTALIFQTTSATEQSSAADATAETLDGSLVATAEAQAIVIVECILFVNDLCVQ